MGIAYKTKRVGSAIGRSRKGIPHTKSAARAAQIHRWQLLGAAARKGQKRAATTAHRVQTAKRKKNVIGSYASAAKWGTAKVLLPTSLVTPFVPGYQPGDRMSLSGHLRRRR